MLLRPTLAAAAPRPPLTQLARGYREAGRPFTRRSKLREAQAQVVETAQTTKGKVGGECQDLSGVVSSHQQCVQSEVKVFIVADNVKAVFFPPRYQLRFINLLFMLPA